MQFTSFSEVNKRCQLEIHTKWHQMSDESHDNVQDKSKEVLELNETLPGVWKPSLRKFRTDGRRWLRCPAIYCCWRLSALAFASCFFLSMFLSNGKNRNFISQFSGQQSMPPSSYCRPTIAEPLTASRRRSN